MTTAEIRERLFLLADEKYKDFQSKLMPTVDKNKIIGVRTPVLREFAKELYKSGECETFLRDLPHRFYEEDDLHALLIDKIKDFDTCLAETERLLPFIDNWATCDMLRPKVFKKEPEKLYQAILRWIKSEKVYTVRYAVGCLNSFYLDCNFCEEHLRLVSEIKSEEYYINMMIAWYFATALSKQYDSAIVYIEKGILSPWVHKKTIQKAIESYRISDEVKEYLRTFR